ncbi:MAG: hypothetical protein U0166_14790 [Acidobacteriota bacterium]
MKGPTTISLHPIPRGATVLTEGAPHRYLYRMEGGRVAVKRGDADLFHLGAGAVMGAVGVVLGSPQLWSVVGSDKGTSFAKKYPAGDLKELLAGNEQLFVVTLASIEMECAHVEKALIEKELLKDDDEARRESRLGNALASLAADVATLSGKLAGGEGGALAGEAMARNLAETQDRLRAVFPMMRDRAFLRALLAGREVGAIGADEERHAKMAHILEAAAKRVAEAVPEL